MLTSAESAHTTRRVGLWTQYLSDGDTAVVACCDESYTFHFCRDQSWGWNLHPLHLPHEDYTFVVANHRDSTFAVANHIAGGQEHGLTASQPDHL